MGQILKNETLYEPVCITLAPEKKHFKDTDAANYRNPIGLFKAIEKHFKAVSPYVLRNSVVVVDEVIAPRYLDPLSSSSSAEQFYALLVLGFPELQFVFLNSLGLTNPSNRCMCFPTWIERVRSEEQPNGIQECQLFDPYRIREKIRKNIWKNSENKKALPFPERENHALSIDDENSFSLFNGYAAFKAGYTCRVVNTLGQLNALQSEKAEESENGEEPENGDKVENLVSFALQLEDLYLNFPDHPSKNVNLPKLEERDKAFPFLEKNDSKKRYLFTVRPSDIDEANKKRISNAITKPTNGFYDLLKKAVPIDSEESELSHYKSFRDGWLNSIRGSLGAAEGEGSNHSVPGRLLFIAERLLDRAEKILDQSVNVPDAIHAATLALEAKELLGGHVPTVALRALSLQHQAEITAESLFFGVEYSLELKERFEDIEAETAVISSWYSDTVRDKQLLNAQLSIVEQLGKRFSALKQFEEEQICLEKGRNLIFALSRKKNRLMRALKPVHWYVQFCLHSIRNFFISILFWIIAFGAFYHFATNGNRIILDVTAPIDWAAFVSSARFFVTFDNSDYLTSGLGNGLYVSGILTVQGIIAFFHLTILASYLYLKISRR
ncbi:MAG: hypothetical protein D6732_04565 [Methanobacteriota archaeon]|nr:MAG: hypothetical protein D6732_04565 [Euryarchaeota archaeon]